MWAPSDTDLDDDRVQCVRGTDEESGGKGSKILSNPPSLNPHSQQPRGRRLLKIFREKDKMLGTKFLNVPA